VTVIIVVDQFLYNINRRDKRIK